MRSIILFLVSLFSIQGAFAAAVDTIKVHSPAMKRDVVCVVVEPDNISADEKLPVIYMLHGHGGSYRTWINGFDTKDLVDQYRVIAVIPDGDRDSWYIDSPIDSSVRYETFISKELIAHIDSNYSTIKSRSGRAITGLSMGGHGALYNAIRNQDVFGAAGSMSGGVDIRPFPNNWAMSEVLGEKKDYPENWDNHTVIEQLHLLTKDSLALIIDCGEQDFFFGVNEALHEKLQYLNIPHRYITDEGAHTGAYWKKAIHYHFLFFSQFFEK
ncbi:MAG: alpha/beta hydrolase family protein [Rikenellaceae bacterium]